MNKEKWLYILLGVLFVTYVAVEYYKPKPLDWTVTYAHKDKNPYGSFVLYDRLEDLFLKKSLTYQTLYELQNADTTGNILILARSFEASEADVNAVFKLLSAGTSICIGARSFSKNFLDTLGLTMHFRPAGAIVNDSVTVSLHGEQYHYPADFMASWFTSYSNEWTTGALADDGNAILIKKNFGNARLILSSTPLAFTNYGLLYADNYRFVSKVLQQMPFGKITYNRFYHSGKPQAATPLRYVLSQAPLKWAIYLTLFVLALYLITGSRRVQRVIPVLQPATNTTVQFIKTIGALYHREGNHRNAARKLIHYFYKDLSERYYIRTFDEKTYPVLSAKTGVPVDAVIQTFELIHVIQHTGKVTEQHLKQLYDQINLFKIH